MNIALADLLSLKPITTGNLDALQGRFFNGVSIDSRSVKKGNVFFGISGEKFNGNLFTRQAFTSGALCAVIEKGTDVQSFKTKPYLVVQDSAKSLGRLANVYRRKFDIPIIAIAGSNGKTTTKEMICSVLNTQLSVLGTQGNLNNHIGVPMTLFRLNKSQDVAVVEIGTNHFGELTYLCDILNPTHGLITNISNEHLEFFRDLHGVARAEGELFKALDKTGVGFVNADDSYITSHAKYLKKKVTFGFTHSEADVQGKFIGMDNGGFAQFGVKPRRKKMFFIQLSVPGMHAIRNALAAATIGCSFEIAPKNIQRGLKKFRTVSKRMEVQKVGGVKILNDTYNANPESVRSALETLLSIKVRGKQIVVLADMLELGKASEIEHIKIGKMISRTSVSCLLTFGQMAKMIHEHANVPLKRHYNNKQKLAKDVINLLGSGDIVLVKGSRGMRMEEIVMSIIEHLN